MQTMRSALAARSIRQVLGVSDGTSGTSALDSEDGATVLPVRVITKRIGLGSRVSITRNRNRVPLHADIIVYRKGLQRT